MPRRPTMHPYSVLTQHSTLLRMFEFLVVAVIEEFLEIVSILNLFLILILLLFFILFLDPHFTENKTIMSFTSENMTLRSFSFENLTFKVIFV